MDVVGPRLHGRLQQWTVSRAVVALFISVIFVWGDGANAAGGGLVLPRVPRRFAKIGFPPASATTLQADWIQFHFSADHAGFNPFESVLSPKNVSRLEVGWAFTAPEGFSTSPVVVDGRVFAGTTGPESSFYALDASSGAVLWTWSEPFSLTFGAAVWRGLVYFGTDHGELHALDAVTGEEVWTAPLGGFVGEPAVSQGVLYVSTSRGFVDAIDAKTGEVKWSTATQALLSPPAVANGVVYQATDNELLWAIDAQTGAVLWTGHIGAAFNESSPAVSGGRVYVGSNDGRLYAFDALGCGQPTCTALWSRSAGSAVESSPAVAYGMVFVGSDAGSDSGKVCAFDAATGQPKWVVRTRDIIQLASPVVANGVVYVGGRDSNLRAIAARTGKVLFRYDIGGASNDAPAVVNGWVYFGSLGGNLYAFHLPGALRR